MVLAILGCRGGKLCLIRVNIYIDIVQCRFRMVENRYKLLNRSCVHNESGHRFLYDRRAVGFDRQRCGNEFFSNEVTITFRWHP